jgi:hypothetical protein
MDTTITQTQLDRLCNAIAYTKGTIGHLPKQSEEDPDWVLIHKGRAHQSMAFLDQAFDIVKQLKKELDMNEKLDKAKKLIQEKWDSQGSCNSCGWHGAYYEHDVWDEEIIDALNNGGILKLSCVNKDDEERDTHRGVEISLKELTQND